ncbi:tRNA lysidine(34) synthetase TilS [Kalamiella sp. sgz302252]|uniref:tRNA lysidine(34) synthetase TilS n=1 Tax=Pantoea sp. sgz302252 TaxID=3341827 RepID=UPI0036D3CE0C
MSLSDLRHQLAGQRQLLVGYSGGLDSSVLLHQLVCLRQQQDLSIRAIHIHHGLNPLADSWAEHCRQQCAQWQVELIVARVQVDGREKGIEAAAREARYQAFRQYIQPGESLLTAQHLDDQCETLLLALKRGSGPAGLAAMPRSAKFAEHLHLRPLLAQTREQLEQWAAEHHLSWIEDDSNQDTRYDRNFLRQVILPELTARWPHFACATARSAALCGEQEQLLDELLAESLNALIDEQGALAIAPLAAMSENRRAALLRRWIGRQQGLMPSRDALTRIWQEVACSREDAEPRLQLGNFEIRRFRDRLYWLARAVSLRDEVIDWPVTVPDLVLPANMGKLVRGNSGVAVRAPNADETVSVRFQAQGKFHIVGRAGSRPIKKIWQELGVAPWLRERTPLLFYNEQLIAAIGIFVTREGDPQEQFGWQICWQKEEQ